MLPGGCRFPKPCDYSGNTPLLQSVLVRTSAVEVALSPLGQSVILSRSHFRIELARCQKLNFMAGFVRNLIMSSVRVNLSDASSVTLVLKCKKANTCIVSSAINL